MSSFLKGAKRYGTPLPMCIIILTLPRGVVQRRLVVICYLADSSLTGYIKSSSQECFNMLPLFQRNCSTCYRPWRCIQYF